MKRKRIKRETQKKIGISTGLVSALVVGMLFLMFTVPQPTIVPTDDGKSWHVVWEGNLVQAKSEFDPGAAAGGILGVYFVNKSASPHVAYAQNDSEYLQTWANASKLGYTNADDFNLEIAHSVDFTIVIRVRANDTMCEDSGTSNFHPEWVRVNISAPDIGITSFTNTSQVVTKNDTSLAFIWLNFFIEEDSGSGNLNIARDETAQISGIRLEAYY